MDKKENDYTNYIIAATIIGVVILGLIVARIGLYESNRFGGVESFFPIFEFNRMGDLPLLEF